MCGIRYLNLSVALPREKPKKGGGAGRVPQFRASRKLDFRLMCASRRYLSLTPETVSGDRMKISELYSMDIYSDNGQYLGEVRDAIVDLERGEVSRLLMQEWRNSDKGEVRKILQQKSVLFKNVKNVGDVVLVAGSGQQRPQESAASPEVVDLAMR